MKLKLLRVIILLTACLVFAMFGGNAAAQQKTAKIAYVEWACATASANVVKAVLEEKMGYKVDLIPVSAAAMWQALAAGDVDAITTAWLPTTHQHYYERLKGKVENLGHNLVGTRIGLVVPTYVTIDSIEEMNAHAAEFNGQITGIDPGAGIMSKTEEAMEKYNLSDLSLMESSDAMMVAVLQDKINKKEWVAVTGWTPHWKFGKWDLKYLNDPKNIYGGDEYIDTVVRLGLKKDHPDLYAFLANFKWSPDDIQTVMAWNEEKDMTPEKSALKWIRENDDKVQAWLP